MKSTNRTHGNDACVQDDDLLPIPELSFRQSAIIVSLLSLACFWRSQYAQFTFDDNSAILNNKDIRTNTPLWNIFENDFWGTKMSSNLSHKSYRPLTVLTYRLNYFLSASYEPWSFHVVNLILHTVNCVLLLEVFSIIFSHLTGPEKAEFAAPRRSLLATILFTVHPIHTESVAAAVGRADLLCCIFFNLSFIFYKRGCTHSKNQQRLDIMPSIICAGLAMFCKEIGITVLGVCAAYDVIIVAQLNFGLAKKLMTNWMLIGQENLWISCKRITLIVLTIITLLTIRIKMMGNSGAPTFQEMDNPASFHSSVIFRILNYIYVYSLNLWLLLSPWWLCFDWAMGCVPVITSYTDPRLLSPFIMIMVMVAMGIRILKILDTPSGRFLAMSCAMMVIPFLPAMNIFFRVGFVIAERNLYIPSIGFCLLVVYGLNIISCFNMGRKIVKLCTILLIVLFVARSYDRTKDWMNEEVLFQSGESVCPLNGKVHYNIGKKYQDAGAFDKAIKYYKDSIRLAPKYDQPMNNLGNILKDQKKYVESEYYLQMAVETTPTFATGWMNLGIVKAETNRKKDAEYCYQKAVRHRRNYPDAYYNWGNLYLEYKEFGKALEKYNKAIELKKDHLQAWQNKINLLGETGAKKDSIKEAEKAGRIFHNNAQLQFLLGNSLGRVGNYKESIKYLKNCLKLNPNHSEAYGSLGAVYHYMKDYKIAEINYKRALALDPHNQGAVQNYKKLKKILQKLGEQN